VGHQLAKKLQVNSDDIKQRHSREISN